MDSIFVSLLILMAAVWVVAIILRPMGVPTIMGELIVGVILGPAVLGWIQPNEVIEVLAELGIFFLMLHAGVETEPREFLNALRQSWALAIVGAVVPFAIAFGLALQFGLATTGAIFVGLTMTATAVVVTLKSLQDFGMQDLRVARVIVAACVIDDLLTLLLFSVILGVLAGGAVDPTGLLVTFLKVGVFFGVSVLIGVYVYPRLTLPFRSKSGKGFTFVLMLALAAGFFAEAIGLHKILGAYLAGLFFEEKVANIGLVDVVRDRLYGIAYSFLGPIFFISMGFHISFSFGETNGVWMIVALTLLVATGQIISAGAMARRLDFNWPESLTVGVGMCGRAEMAFVLASLALSMGAFDKPTFSVVVFTAFLLNLMTPMMLKGCVVLLGDTVTRQKSNSQNIDSSA